MAESKNGVVAVDDEQRQAWDAGRLPAPERLRDGWWSIPSAIPEGGLPGTLTYAHIGRDGVHVIDPGWGSDANVALLAEGLAAADASLDEVRTIVVTHHHPDHLGLAERLRVRTGATIVMSARERQVLSGLIADASGERVREERRVREWGVPVARRGELLEHFARPFTAIHTEPDRVVADGDIVAVGERRLEVIMTPGHTGGHLCLADRAARMLFSGDHVLPRIHSGIGIGTVPGDEPLSDMLASLDRLEEFDDFEILPGHEFRFTGLAARRASIAAHQLRRTAEVAALIGQLGNQPVWEYARRLHWTSGWDGLQGFWLHSALRQTEMHLTAVRLRSVDAWLSPGG